MNMLAVSLLLLPVVAGFALLYGPTVYASLNPGNQIMTASDYTFQSDTFSADGAIGSTVGDPEDLIIVTGKWSLDAEGGMANFTASLTMVNASGLGYRTVELSNLSSSKVTVDGNGTAHVTGMLDVKVDGKEKLAGINSTIALAKLSALNMTLGAPEFIDKPIYGVADPQGETVTASAGLMPEGNSISGNITEKFRLPQLPNPFK